MKVEPPIISENTWWTVRLHPSQSPIGQLQFTVKRRPDGSWAKDVTYLDAQEEFILGLMRRSAVRALERLYRMGSFHWVCYTNSCGYCSVHLIPTYELVPVHQSTHDEIAKEIKEAIRIYLSGRAD